VLNSTNFRPKKENENKPLTVQLKYINKLGQISPAVEILYYDGLPFPSQCRQWHLLLLYQVIPAWSQRKITCTVILQTKPRHRFYHGFKIYGLASEIKLHSKTASY
jgi:hypothetical protein